MLIYLNYISGNTFANTKVIQKKVDHRVRSWALLSEVQVALVIIVAAFQAHDRYLAVVAKLQVFLRVSCSFTLWTSLVS